MTDAKTDTKKPKSLQELKAEAESTPGGGKVRTCPGCGKRLFYVTTTWENKDGTIRRLRKCSACGHVANSSEVFDE
ncbi:MAG: transposase [Planctomycetes bacterium]|nr:transposase [Planctomycetota bacterium]